MLKLRIIPIQLLMNGRLVKSKQFSNFRDVGDPVSSSKIYNSQFADELIFLNINREGHSMQSLVETLHAVSDVCFMPLAVGGGVLSVEDASYIIKNGADKVVLNSVCYESPHIITEVATIFGSQAVVVCIDARWDKRQKDYILYSHGGSIQQKPRLQDWVSHCQASGAGEIMIQSIDCDGMMQGFDLCLIKKVVEVASIPIIAAGGSGNYEHLRALFCDTTVNAVACGSIFNFSDSNLIRAKAFLSNYDLPFKVT